MNDPNQPQPQPLIALQKANTNRLKRGRIKHQLKTGEITLAEALEDPAIQTMQVIDLLMSQRRWGVQRARQLMREVGVVSEVRQVRQLTVRQCGELVRLALLPPHQWSRDERRAA